MIKMDDFGLVEVIWGEGHEFWGEMVQNVQKGYKRVILVWMAKKIVIVFYMMAILDICFLKFFEKYVIKIFVKERRNRALGNEKIFQTPTFGFAFSSW